MHSEKRRVNVTPSWNIPRNFANARHAPRKIHPTTATGTRPRRVHHIEEAMCPLPPLPGSPRAFTAPSSGDPLNEQEKNVGARWEQDEIIKLTAAQRIWTGYRERASSFALLTFQPCRTGLSVFANMYVSPTTRSMPAPLSQRVSLPRALLARSHPLTTGHPTPPPYSPPLPLPSSFPSLPPRHPRLPPLCPAVPPHVPLAETSNE
jgi:hypothetical protein